MDGTTLRTPDSPANREHFGAQGYASGKVASYPQVRAVTLTAIPTHLIADINFGRYDTNEMVYAKSLLAQIPEDSLTVFDKGFLAAEILCGLTMNARNRHFLIPAKANTCWEVVSGSADDAMVRMDVYAGVARPSEKVAVRYFSTVDPKLFKNIVAKYNNGRFDVNGENCVTKG